MERKILAGIGITLLLFAVVSVSSAKNQQFITSSTVKQTVETIVAKSANCDKMLLTKGVNHAASLWRAEDGDQATFNAFCAKQFVADSEEKKVLFLKLSQYLESLYGHFNKIALDMQQNVHLQTGELSPIDHMFAGYSAGAHLSNDMYGNKIAFIVALNFPYYSTKEKIAHEKKWNDLQWGYARMGDVFSSRVPSKVGQHIAKISAQADAYIAEYNVYMGNLVDSKGKTLFPKDKVLLSHWNLRDEIKANYPKGKDGLKRQAMIYKVMERIVDQTIPKDVINSDQYQWEPFANTTQKNSKAVQLRAEENGRYQQILNTYHALRAIDEYEPVMNTAIQRAFDGGMQMTQQQVEEQFDNFLSSPVLKDVAKIIRKRLGRKLQPWDIWYDGFKARSSIDEAKLDAMTEKKYPDAAAMEADLKNMLQKLGFSNQKAQFLADRIAVDPARGSGHAWGASMKSEKAHLRTRIPASGMNYKGYNIAIHEFGHNVEQTISLNDVPYYMMNGVPNTAFTEALAFVFQERDLFLLDINDDNPDKEYLKTLDIYWSLYEIMGVSMVDMKTWKWMYAHPNANATELRDAVVNIAKQVWNQYFAPVYGIKDQTILGIYSHMISSPIYLQNYAYGHLIHFQLEEHFKTNPFAKEVERIFSIGLLTPNQWMMKAVGKPLSNEPIIKAAAEAAEHIK